MSEKSIILLEHISSSQAETESVDRAAVSTSPVDVPEEKIFGERGKQSPAEGPEESIDVGSCSRWRLVRRQMWKTMIKTLMLLVALTRLRSPGTILRFHTLRNPSSKETCQEE